MPDFALGYLEAVFMLVGLVLMEFGVFSEAIAVLFEGRKVVF